MCGIVGFCNIKRKITEPQNCVQNMTYSLNNRGPDEKGFFYSDNVHLGHRRLTIIDAENGKQPMSAKINDNTYTIVYNGQIYNAQDIRNELIENGFTFKRIL